MKKLVLFFVLVGLSNPFSLVAQNSNRFVLMSEYPDSMKKPNCLRFDRHGDLYPEINIAREKMEKLNFYCDPNNVSTSRNLYELDDSIRNVLQKKYSVQDSTETFEIYEKRVVRSKIDSINELAKKENCKSITFIMVGFNNHYLNQTHKNDDANYKLKQLKNKINSYISKHKLNKTLVVEVFWDGTESDKEIDAAFNFAFSSVSSFWAGIGLREIINGLECKEIKMISHSMGANIITESLFNQTSKIGSKSKLNNELNIWRDTIKPPTKDKNISVALIAPAIPGYNTFIDYSPKQDNWKFIIGYNTNDEILKKEFVLGLNLARKFGSTTLGCDTNEVKSVINLFNNNNLLIPIDFSMHNNQKQTEHDLLKYMEQLQYDAVLQNLYK